MDEQPAVRRTAAMKSPIQQIQRWGDAVLVIDLLL
jgi:hypothetical protein